MRRMITSCCLALLIVIGLVGFAAPANAIGPTCTASSQTTFSPGLTLTPTTQDITFAAGFSNCLTPGRPDITSGTRTGSFTGPRSCLSPLPPPSNGTFVVTWNTTQTSTIIGTVTAQDVAGQTVHTITGTVTSGLFTGSAYTEVIAQTSLDLLSCITPPGVRSQSGLGTLTIL
jgi:hypothetical protein